MARAHIDKRGLTHLKLQKLVYYAQGATLAILDGRTLFDEAIHAWLHGPVCSALYDQLAGMPTLDLPTGELRQALTRFDHDARARSTLTDEWAAFGDHEGWQLEMMTKQEAPWLEAIQHSGLGAVITPEAMHAYFAAFLT